MGRKKNYTVTTTTDADDKASLDPTESSRQVLIDSSKNNKDGSNSVTITNDTVTNSSSDLEKFVASIDNTGIGRRTLPQVYGDVASKTPSTPGDETKALLKMNTPNGFDGTQDPPRDRLHIVYLIFLINGISTLMPWNMFITAESYFTEYKFGGTHEEYSKNFLSYLGICAQVPNLLLNFVNAFAHTSGNLGVRVIGSLFILIVMMLITIVLAMVDSSSWPGVFFVVTMLTAVICNGAVGVYQNCIFGMAANFPMKYSGAVILGSNISGTLTTFISLFSMMLAPSPKMAAIYYFTTALFVVLLSFDSYFLLPRCKFYRYHQQLHRAHTSEVDMKKASGFKGYIGPYVQVFKEVWIQLFNIFFIFFVSLSIFPAMQVGIQPANSDYFLAGKYYTLLTCFMAFNFFAMVGNVVPSFIKNPGPKYLWIFVVARGLLVPYFFFSNYRANCRMWPVYFTNDHVYTFMSIVLGFTSGYFSSLVMMYTPRLVEKAHARIAAMLASFFLILGIVCGINNTLLIAHVAENWGPLPSNSTICAL